MAPPQSLAEASVIPPAARRPALRRGWEPLVRAGFAAGLVAVAVVSLLPGLLMPGGGPSDKLMHALCYGVLAANGALAVRRRGAAWLGLGAGLFAFGAMLEAGQGLLPGRDASLADALANGAGILAGLALTAAVLVLARALVRRQGRSAPHGQGRGASAAATAPRRSQPVVAGARSSSGRAGQGRPVQR